MSGRSEKTMTETTRQTGRVLGIHIDALGWNEAIGRLLGWARQNESRYVTICNAHVVVTASQDSAYRTVIESSDMATPDGAPVAWMLRRQGFAGQQRINGPDLTWALASSCEAEDVSVYFYGSTAETLAKLRQRLLAAFPALRVAGMESPPFRQLSLEEDSQAVERMNASGAGIVFVGLGCPKQERWMAEHRGRVQAVMIGVGAAFDFHAGTVSRAPAWMRNNGLEWLHRLASEPRRLWKRYLVTNSLFVVGAIRQLVFGHAR
jgi:N-acetylglucosaminyldiphosphoundecaprenol N-acetyl-beta-D-mannosaminyltransferase